GEIKLEGDVVVAAALGERPGAEVADVEVVGIVDVELPGAEVVGAAAAGNGADEDFAGGGMRAAALDERAVAGIADGLVSRDGEGARATESVSCGAARLIGEDEQAAVGDLIGPAGVNEGGEALESEDFAAGGDVERSGDEVVG